MTPSAVQEPPPPQIETTRAQPDYWIQRDMLLGRPLEDRSFEAVEATAAFAAGVAIGTAVAGPIGAVVGGVVGLSGGVIAGEALERAVGRAATTTDAAEHEPADLTQLLARHPRHPRRAAFVRGPIAEPEPVAEAEPAELETQA